MMIMSLEDGQKNSQHQKNARSIPELTVGSLFSGIGGF